MSGDFVTIGRDGYQKASPEGNCAFIIGEVRPEETGEHAESIEVGARSTDKRYS